MVYVYHIFTYREVAGITFDAFRSDEASNGEPCGTVQLITLHNGVAPGHWHVVNHPLVHVALMDALTKKFQLGFMVLVAFLISLLTELLTSDVFSKLDLWANEVLGTCIKLSAYN